ncbi:MAG TPA: hypothetical protein VEM40_13455 [Nitrospirota bacterium]|nr:hypothetical protein [Nitrospirota bacterium]
MAAEKDQWLTRKDHATNPDGTVRACGSNACRQLGDGTMVTTCLTGNAREWPLFGTLVQSGRLETGVVTKKG